MLGRPKQNKDAVARFAESFNELKAARALTNQDVADALNIKYASQVAYWSAGHGLPSKKNQKRLAELFDVDVPTLLGLNGKSLMAIFNAT